MNKKTPTRGRGNEAKINYILQFETRVTDAVVVVARRWWKRGTATAPIIKYEIPCRHEKAVYA